MATEMEMARADNPDTRGPESKSVEDWFLECEAPLLRYAFRYVRDLEVSEEIVQEAFMRLHRQIDQVTQPRPWLYRTVHNLALNHCRAGKKIVPLEFDADGRELRIPVDGALAPDQELERTETIEQTRRCLEVLDARGRELIRLKFEEGLSYQEMSERMGLSVGNVGYILHHTLKRLASELETMGVRL